jgi:hypothetical protein
MLVYEEFGGSGWSGEGSEGVRIVKCVKVAREDGEETGLAPWSPTAIRQLTLPLRTRGCEYCARARRRSKPGQYFYAFSLFRLLRESFSFAGRICSSER